MVEDLRAQIVPLKHQQADFDVVIRPDYLLTGVPTAGRRRRKRDRGPDGIGEFFDGVDRRSFVLRTLREAGRPIATEECALAFARRREQNCHWRCSFRTIRLSNRYVGTSETRTMKRLLVSSLIALTSSQVLAMDSLSDLSWKNRVVLVFGTADDQKVTRQVKVLETQKGQLEERDMVVIFVSREKATAVYGNATGLDPAKLRKDAKVEDDSFHVVLVGKDGGIKLHSEKVVGDVEMFDLIDRMPMRRAERN